MVSQVEQVSVEGTDASVPALERALDVLELLAKTNREMTLSEVVSSLDLPKGSAHRILATLTARGYVSRGAGVRGGYRLGNRLLTLTRRANGQIDLAEAAREPMRRLAVVTGESCQLSVRAESKAVCILRVVSPSHPDIALMGGVGSVFPLHAVAVGKVLLAFAPNAEVLLQSSLDGYTEATLTDGGRLLAELQGIRETGVAYDRQEYKRGLGAVAAPVREANGMVCAALGVPYLSGAEGDTTQLTVAVQRTAREISENLGFQKEAELV